MDKALLKIGVGLILLTLGCLILSFKVEDARSRISAIEQRLEKTK